MHPSDPEDTPQARASKPPEHGVHRPSKPWPLSWILIIILTYILFQTGYFVLGRG